MNSDVDCPYCGKGQEINHDDGNGYEEDRRHEQECGSCEKNFVFTTSIIYHYEAEKADCLNGGDHRVKMSSTYPRQYSVMNCENCDYKRNPRADEFAEAGILTTPTPPQQER